jgi:hypothetical protein
MYITETEIIIYGFVVLGSILLLGAVVTMLCIGDYLQVNEIRKLKKEINDLKKIQ